MKHFILLLLCYLAVTLIPCQADVIQTASTYSFPFKPGDETWETYQTANELKEALQIPSEVINMIATDNLLDLCISYPYNFDMLSTDNDEDGFMLLCGEFNGYPELLKRNDLGAALISRCEAIPSEIDSIPSMNEDEVDELSLKYYVFYYIVGLEEVISQFDDIQRESYYDAISENLSKMSQYPDVFGISYQQCLKLLPSRPYTLTYTNTSIQTPNGYEVPALKLIESTDMSGSDKRKLKKDVETGYPGAIVLSEATGKYNCHAYAWHHKKVPGSDAVWINDPKTYWDTGCYYEVPVSEAEIVTYIYNGKITHSAVRKNDNEYVSKWGAWPLVQHSPTNVPNNDLDQRNNYGSVYKGYKRLYATLTGNENIRTSSTFSVGKIPGCYTGIEWSISDDYYSKNCMTVNNDGTCTITRNDTKDIYGATLSATIKYGRYDALKLTMPVYAYKNFLGTYNCAGHSNATLAYPYIINTTLGDNVLIKSPSLKGATVTYEGDITPRYFSAYDDASSAFGLISTGLSSTGSALVMHVVTTHGEKYDLIILAKSRAGSLTSFFENNVLSIRYDQETDTYSEYIGQMSDKSTDGVQISVEIHDLLTDAKIYETRSIDHEVQIYTGDWKSGTYIITAKAQDEVMTKKILIK